MKEALLPVFGATLFAALILDFLPRRPRRGLYFGVTTGADIPRSDHGRAIASRYRLWVWAGCVVSCGWLALAYIQHWVNSAGLAFLPLLACAMAGWVHAWRAVRPHSVQPGTVRAADMVETPVGLPLAALAGLIPLAVMSAAAIVLALNYDELPERFPMHYGASGEADRFVAKSFVPVFAPPAIGFGVYVLVAFNAWALAFRSRTGGSPETQEWRRKSRRVHLGVMLVILFTLGLLFAGLAITPLFGNRIPLPMWAIVGFPLLIVLVAVYPLWKLSEQPGGPGDDTPDECWKLGAFYYNPDDPALMVEKRDNLGYTLNFGHTLSWIFLSVTLVLILGPVFLLLKR